jgi:hypothetical protein
MAAGALQTKTIEGSYKNRSEFIQQAQAVVKLPYVGIAEFRVQSPGDAVYVLPSGLRVALLIEVELLDDIGGGSFWGAAQKESSGVWGLPHRKEGMTVGAAAAHGGMGSGDSRIARGARRLLGLKPKPPAVKDSTVAEFLRHFIAARTNLKDNEITAKTLGEYRPQQLDVDPDSVYGALMEVSGRPAPPNSMTLKEFNVRTFTLPIEGTDWTVAAYAQRDDVLVATDDISAVLEAFKSGNVKFDRDDSGMQTKLDGRAYKTYGSAAKFARETAADFSGENFASRAKYRSLPTAIYYPLSGKTDYLVADYVLFLYVPLRA